ncbi:MAG TPA: inositol monophosphatase family protein [Leptolyngbyaceae cyanobacterium M33_DOE_097]|uniref:Inositol monophosphatase family protein n=1 Tax=Oscillatoriales cyanobacterium SpSt-418 TaxID=2282169 RepID=A0A7C3PK89_9CYAN|nr:inositol monophosphatase family protein [Leptolyngbyaceae cyanobacterium M33_DOE_097]
MTPILDQDEQQMRDAIFGCRTIIEQMKGSFEIAQKGPGDYVTSVDAALDRRLTEVIQSLFPADGLITEENPGSRLQFTESFKRLWCVDPLDGTEDFIAGNTEYAVMVGLLENYQPIAGWIYAPETDRFCWGGKGWGLYEASAGSTPKSLEIVALPLTSTFCPILIGKRDKTKFGETILQQIPGATFHSHGSFGLKVLEVIQGKAGMYVYLNRRVKLWDTCGPIALAIAAGLTCCDLDGEPIQFNPAALDQETLTHHQPMLIGWANYVEELRPRLKAAIAL